MTQWGADLIFGGAFTLGPRVSILLLPSIGYRSASNNSRTRTALVLGASVPLLVHLAPHFFVGMDPQLSTDLVASTSEVGGNTDRVTTFSFQAMFGGWI